MYEVLIVFMATLAYAVIDLARRRSRARVLRARQVSRGEPQPRARVPDPPPRWYEGARLDGGYVVKEPLGSGAFGEVHVVENRTLDRRWAAKVIRRDLVSDAARRHALLRELAHGFRVAGHPNIVRTEMFRSFGDEIAIFSELVDGGTLASVLPTGRFASLDDVLDLGLQLAWALEAIHLAGLIHGDVKPSNVLLTRKGVAKLADLGLASLSQRSDGNSLTGTLLYRSPEQANRFTATAASDVWSWAVTMIAMLLGEHPSHAGGEVAAHTLASLRIRDSSVRTAPDDHSYQLLSACLQKDPKQRITMTAIVNELGVRLGRAGAPPKRPVAVSAASTSARVVDELTAHTEALRQLLVDATRGEPAVHDAALCSGLAKADCHRRHGDGAGAATTLHGVLDATFAATPRLRAGTWLELGFIHHDRGIPAAAVHAFEYAASTIEDPLLRARAHHGAAAATWTLDDRETARARAHTAVMLAAHVIDTATTGRADAIQVHAAALLTLASMLREHGDHGYEACVAHVIAACETLDDVGRQTLIRGLVLRGDFAGARALVGALDGQAPSRSGLHGAPVSSTIALLTATIDLEEARALASDRQVAAAVACARRARNTLRPLAEGGTAIAALPLAVAEVHLAWLLHSTSAQVEFSVHGALATLDDAARNGRRDASALARWARAQPFIGVG